MVYYLESFFTPGREKLCATGFVVERSPPKPWDGGITSAGKLAADMPRWGDPSHSPVSLQTRQGPETAKTPKNRSHDAGRACVSGYIYKYGILCEASYCSLTQPRSFQLAMLHFVSECVLIILIAYPILFFLVEQHLCLAHLTPILLLGLTVTSTLVISAMLNWILVLWGETEEGEDMSCCREKAEVLSSENNSIPEGVV
ncbi:uncharacterized protein BT62DRAFT_1008782 [Guyanagaster necrorhizus]|uniref:Uncharacterized protein n=1 Tax=Guyanagaster necrorhizus TaxID=856835 RepID=A0A9P8AQD0_9AGAR|nr:uncharacterized protein BT62DRAFT_1008782 [Guyanagaster necrorhizus MCA 3950]KAG7443721.1 hypothetical protein BT62DRAFT_1008782 [Guyanagaster necrorhizus MCA 3950]